MWVMSPESYGSLFITRRANRRKRLVIFVFSESSFAFAGKSGMVFPMWEERYRKRYL